MYKLQKIELSFEQYKILKEVLNLPLIDSGVKIRLNFKQYEILKKILKLQHQDIIYLNGNEKIKKDSCVVSYLDLRKCDGNDDLRIDKVQIKLNIREYNELKEILKQLKKVDFSEYDFDYKMLEINIKLVDFDNDYFIVGNVGSFLNLREIISDYFLMSGFDINGNPTEKGLFYENLIDLLYF